jgi:hypothetical protein
MKMITVGPDEGGPWSFGRKVERSLAELEVPAKLAIVFLPIGAPHPKFLAEISDVVKAPVVGATTGGVHRARRELDRRGLRAARRRRPGDRHRRGPQYP